VNSPSPQAQDILYPVRWKATGGVLVLALLLFGLSSGATAFWGDSASFASHLDTTPKPFARSYWLYKMLGRLFVTLGASPALAAASASAVFGAAAVALLHALTQRITGQVEAATLAAASLAVAQTFWLHSSVAEVYSLLALLEIGLLFLALGAPVHRREALGLGLLAGLALNHHRLLLFSFPVLAAFLWLAVPPNRRLDLCRSVGIGLLLGGLPWIVLCFRFPPSSLVATESLSQQSLWFQKVLLGGRWSSAHLGADPGAGMTASVGYLAKLLALNFPSPAALLAGVGLITLRATSLSRRVLLGGLLVAFTLAGSLFGWTGDQYAFFSPLLPLVALLAGLGLASRLGKAKRSFPALMIAASLATPPFFYAVLSFGPTAPDSATRAALLERQEFAWPPKAGYSFPEDWARKRLEALPPRATLVAQWAEGTIFEYLQSEGLRTDVTLQLHRSGPLDLAALKAPVFVTWKPTRPSPPEAFKRQGLQLEGQAPGFRGLVLPDSP